MKITLSVLILYFSLSWKAFTQIDEEPPKVIIFSRIPEAQWGELKFSHADFSQNRTLPYGIFIGRDLNESILSSNNLMNTGIEQAESLTNVNFDGAKNLPKNIFADRDIYGTILNGQDLTYTGADKAKSLTKVNFTGAINPPPNLLADKDIAGAVLNGLDLTHAGIMKAKGLTYVNFTGTRNPPPNFLAKRNISFSSLRGLDVSQAGILQATGLNTADFSGAIFSKDVLFAPDDKITELMKNKMTGNPVSFEGKEMSFKEMISLIDLAKAFAKIEEEFCPNSVTTGGRGDFSCVMENTEGELLRQMDPLQEIVRKFLPADLARLQLTAKAYWNYGNSADAKRAMWEYYLPTFSSLPQHKWDPKCTLAFEKLVKEKNLLKHPFFR